MRLVAGPEAEPWGLGLHPWITAKLHLSSSCFELMEPCLRHGRLLTSLQASGHAVPHPISRQRWAAQDSVLCLLPWKQEKRSEARSLSYKRCRLTVSSFRSSETQGSALDTAICGTLKNYAAAKACVRMRCPCLLGLCPPGCWYKSTCFSAFPVSLFGRDAEKFHLMP